MNVVCESSVDETVNCRISVVHLVGCDCDRITMIYIYSNKMLIDMTTGETIKEKSLSYYRR